MFPRFTSFFIILLLLARPLRYFLFFSITAGFTKNPAGTEGWLVESGELEQIHLDERMTEGESEAILIVHSYYRTEI